MIVTFYKGTFRKKDRADVAVCWAETDFGVTALLSGADELVRELDMEQIAAVESVVALDLPELDREGIDVIVESILKGRYLDMPGVKGKGEAVLFILVNEAIHRLAEIAKEENEE
jgi:hypothetical protein